MKTTGWQKHTVRGFISILGSKGGVKVTSTRREVFIGGIILWTIVAAAVYLLPASGRQALTAGVLASASPAGGYMARHIERQKTLVEQAFGKYK